MKKEFEIKDEWVGLEIHPETPREGVTLEKRFGAENLKYMAANLRRMGAKYGLEFKEFTILSNSHYALEAAEYARENGSFHEYHERLMEAYFSNSKDIGDINVLIDLAEGLKLDKDEMRKAIEEKRYREKLEKDAKIAAEYGINSTPTFIINDKYLVVGAQDISEFRRILSEIK